MYWEDTVDNLKYLLECTRSSVENELNYLYESSFTRNKNERIEYLNNLLTDINKALIQ